MSVWRAFSQFVIKNRVLLASAILLLTAFMGYQGTQIKLSYELAKILPTSDEHFQRYEAFKARYGEDGNVMVVGIQTPDMYTLPLFKDWYELNNEIKAIDGIKEVLSNANLFELIRNDSLTTFEFSPLLKAPPTQQAEVDSLAARIARLPFYEGFVSSEDGTAHLMAITFDQSKLNSKSRIEMAHEIRDKVQAFGQAHDLEVRLSGMPYIRTEFMSKVSKEMGLFMLLAFGVTAVIFLGCD